MSEVPLHRSYGRASPNSLGPPEEWCVFALSSNPEREFFIDNLLVRIHLIIQMILVDRPCAMGV